MKSPKHVKLKLKVVGANCATGKVTKWEFKTAGGGGLGNAKGDLDFKSKTSFDGPVWIDLAVEDATYGMTFDLDNPINVVSGEACPKDGGVAEREFVVVRVREKRLTLIDLNETDGVYSYTLCFKSAQSATGTFLLDPEIRNGGGGFVQE